jgi:hypothetical protein
MVIEGITFNPARDHKMIIKHRRSERMYLAREIVSVADHLTEYCPMAHPPSLVAVVHTW